ncbi:hypothetical protein D3C80_1966420 [compost metagenome]
MPDIAGYNTRTALAMVSNAPISATMPITRLRNRKPKPPANARSGCSRGCGGGGNCGRRSKGINVSKVPNAARP